MSDTHYQPHAFHVCLVSAQAAANLLPALDPALKPAKVILVVSTKMAQQASDLSAVLKENGITVEARTLRDEHNYLHIEEDLIQLADQLQDSHVALNITGGTKLMSGAAQTVGSVYGWDMFYVDVDTDGVSWLTPKERPSQKLTEHLRIRHYLRSYGFTLSHKPQRPQASREQQQVTDTLIKDIGSLEKPLSTLNWLAQQAEQKNALSITLEAHQQDDYELDALLRHFSSAQALSLHGNQIRFASANARDFVKGGWLELHVMQAVHTCTGPLNIRDKATGLEVITAGGVKNELDVVFMAQNRLFVIECKTARMDNPKAPKANDTLFKLAENARRVGGVGSQRMLVSYRALNPSEKKLAEALNIICVCGADIRQLDARLKAWVKPKA